MSIKTTGIHELLSFGYLGTGVGDGGVSCLGGGSALSALEWNRATVNMLSL